MIDPETVDQRETSGASELYDDGMLVDGHGERLYSVSEEVAQLHHEAVRRGWRHDPTQSAYRNLRALVEIVPGGDRRVVEPFAFAFILGYGPNGVALSRALRKLGVGNGGGQA